MSSEAYLDAVSQELRYLERSLNAQPRAYFEKYVDVRILNERRRSGPANAMMSRQSLGIKEHLVDLYGKNEILFFGPDDGGDCGPCGLGWAALHARDRGAEAWWKSFTTGKSAKHLGGMPHDTYGMTSLGFRQYVIGTYKQLGLRKEDITKVRTGGLDGDLGSNEILLSSDKTVTVIDGNHVLANPARLNREELIRLVKAHIHLASFDLSKLAAEVVADGTDFRNGAHLRFKADLFVPCGGRPEALNISNVTALVDSEGKSHFKYIVESANLFFTQQARLYLEKRKLVLFKDSSAKKGGVTSLPLEVLAGLALSTDEYLNLMIFKDGKPSEFYQSYMRDI
ncbi:NAD(P)-binding protein [Trametopsis cervina]|nr:NAD(P)-binding protein [Trametopsis cervina]